MTNEQYRYRESLKDGACMLILLGMVTACSLQTEVKSTPNVAPAPVTVSKIEVIGKDDNCTAYVAHGERDIYFVNCKTGTTAVSTHN